MPTKGYLDAQTNQYKADLNISTYEADNGLLVLPVMGPSGTPPTVIRMHGGVGFRTVNWKYTKRGTPPVIPAMVNTPSGDVILSSIMSLPVPSIAGDENMYDYTAAGVYEYVQSTTRTSLNGFQTGRKPYQEGALAATILAANSGQQAMITQGLVVLNNSQSGQPLVSPLTPQQQNGWVDPVGNLSINATAIDFTNNNYQYYDTGVSPLFFSTDLIL